MNLLTVSGIHKQIPNGFSLLPTTFNQQHLQKIAIAGETGSGKSTLLQIIVGFIQPDGGTVFLEDERVIGPNEQLLPGHKKIAYLSQHFELRNNWRVEEILSYANRISDEAANEIYEICEIKHLLRRTPDQLSGGEKQRIATAKLLIAAPKLLVLDEPYSNLDMVHKAIMKAVVNNIGDKLGITCILVSHDPMDTLSWADTIIVMCNGNILQTGTPLEIYQQPINTYVAGLFGKFNLFTAEEAVSILGLDGAKFESGKSVFLRPERFKIVSENATVSFKALIHAIHFMGIYYEIEAIVSNKKILLQTIDNQFFVGELIHLTITNSPKIWQL